MNIYRNAHNFIKLSGSFFYIESTVVQYFKDNLYITYCYNSNNVWFSGSQLANPTSVTINTSVQDLLNGTICK